jgi:hypothetical protein
MSRIPSFFEIELHAPPSYCFAWLTDYQATDNQINPGLTERKVVERRPDFVRLEDMSLGPPLNKRKADVYLSAPDAWDVAAVGTIYDYDLHYRLTATPRGTRLTIAGLVTTKPGCPFGTREENHARFEAGWANYKRALEADYTSHKDASAAASR